MGTNLMNITDVDVLAYGPETSIGSHTSWTQAPSGCRSVRYSNVKDQACSRQSVAQPTPRPACLSRGKAEKVKIFFSPENGPQNYGIEEMPALIASRCSSGKRWRRRCVGLAYGRADSWKRPTLFH